MDERSISGDFSIAYNKSRVEFTRISMCSGRSNSMVFDMGMMEFTVALQKWIRNEGLIQDIFPTLNADQREFIQTGITPSEWAEMFEGAEEDTDTELNNPEVA